MIPGFWKPYSLDSGRYPLVSGQDRTILMARRFAELSSVMEEGGFGHVTCGCDVDHSYT